MSAFSSGKLGSKAHCPLKDQADPGTGVADVTQEGILLRKYCAVEAPCTEAHVSDLTKEALHFLQCCLKGSQM